MAALRWTNKNIGTFGGDPNNVTMSGVSAGAVSVNYLYLTNITTGLFQKAIQISGSALNPWADLANPKEVHDFIAYLKLNLLIRIVLT